MRLSILRSGIFLRLMLGLGAALCGAVVVMGYWLFREAENLHEAAQLEQTKALARSLAEGSLDALVSKEYELLERWVAAAVPGERYAYAFLATADGQILTHSDPAKVGWRIAPVGQLQSYLVIPRDADGQSVTEVVYPVLAGKRHLANAHVAYYIGFVPKFESAFRIGVVLAVFLVLLSAATFVIARQVTEPLRRLAASMKIATLAAPANIEPLFLSRRDEVGTLARAFTDLQKRLAMAYESLRHEEDHLKDLVQQRTAQLEATNKELEAFAYSVSHDLRAPLRAIDGFSQVLQEDYGDKFDDAGKDFLARVRGATQHMGHLIDDLLGLSRVTRQEMRRQTVNLTEIAQHIAQELQRNESGRKVSFEIAEQLQAPGDPGLLKIVLDNLLGNAWKYTAKHPIAKIQFGAITQNGEPVYFVRDDGAGFDMRHTEKLFGAFQRLHSADEFPGTGVGLATVARIIQRHGGSLRAEAAVEKGATFYFTLPKAS